MWWRIKMVHDLFGTICMPPNAKKCSEKNLVSLCVGVRKGVGLEI